MERLKEKESDFSDTLEEIIADFLAVKFPESRDVLSADDLIKIGADGLIKIGAKDKD